MNKVRQEEDGCLDVVEHVFMGHFDVKTFEYQLGAPKSISP